MVGHERIESKDQAMLSSGPHLSTTPQAMNKIHQSFPRPASGTIGSRPIPIILEYSKASVFSHPSQASDHLNMRLVQCRYKT
jgi:hypothetical protein